MSGKPTVYVAGASGMVGTALTPRLEEQGYNLLHLDGRVDLRNQRATNDLIEHLRPDCIVLAAAKVGGIQANIDYPAEFIYDNIMIQSNVMEAARRLDVQKLLFLASSCVYPRLCPQPMKEEYLLGGYLEPTNQAYAVAKISGIVIAQAYRAQYGCNFISILPPNLYGPGDTFDLARSHVISALIRKMDEAKSAGKDWVEVWGTGAPKREFLYVDDLADACIFALENYDSDEILNVGAGTDITIRELAYLIKNVVEFEGEIRFDASKPDGMPAKRLDISRIQELGWSPKTSLPDGLTATYQYYLAEVK